MNKYFILKSLVFVLISFYRKYSGLRTHYVPRKYGHGVWCYAEKGKKSFNSPTFLFLHGFGGSKDDWPSIIKSISSSNHMIVVDLPGHGETTYLQNHDKPTVESYSESLKEFLEEIDLKEENQIYLIGFVKMQIRIYIYFLKILFSCSFGGAVAAFFTHKYPKNVKLLALLCPAIRTPIITELCQKVLDKNLNILIPQNGDDFITMVNILCFKTIRFPHKIMQAFVNLNYNKRKNLLEKGKLIINRN
jgi:abhydrolase domain-containing protein 6